MAEQLLHLVFGGELEDPSGITFSDLDALDIVGIYPDYATALDAWRGAAQRTVDNAHTRYFVVHLHRLLEPDAGSVDQEVATGDTVDQEE
ncbi:MAG: DUF4170 domain-containing protein [Geminicoccaceae bacterium]